jgi:hypothetical protein
MEPLVLDVLSLFWRFNGGNRAIHTHCLGNLGRLKYYCCRVYNVGLEHIWYPNLLERVLVLFRVRFKAGYGKLQGVLGWNEVTVDYPFAYPNRNLKS